MAKESLSLQNHIVWLYSIFIRQNIKIMHNPDDKPSNCFILLMFSNLFNFHGIHEREPWTSTIGGIEGGCWYVHFASCFYIDIYGIMGCHYTLCHNTYAYSLLFYKVYMKRGNAGSWNSGLEKEQILETYSAQLQKSWNSTKVIFGNNKKY